MCHPYLPHIASRLDFLGEDELLLLHVMGDDEGGRRSLEWPKVDLPLTIITITDLDRDQI
jgi:hypothetical protein